MKLFTDPAKTILLAAVLPLICCIAANAAPRTKTAVAHCLAVAGTMRIYKDCLEEYISRK